MFIINTSTIPQTSSALINLSCRFSYLVHFIGIWKVMFTDMNCFHLRKLIKQYIIVLVTRICIWLIKQILFQLVYFILASTTVSTSSTEGETATTSMYFVIYRKTSPMFSLSYSECLVSCRMQKVLLVQLKNCQISK